MNIFKKIVLCVLLSLFSFHVFGAGEDEKRTQQEITNPEITVTENGILLDREDLLSDAILSLMNDETTATAEEDHDDFEMDHILREIAPTAVWLLRFSEETLTEGESKPVQKATQQSVVQVTLQSPAYGRRLEALATKLHFPKELLHQCVVASLFNPEKAKEIGVFFDMRNGVFCPLSIYTMLHAYRLEEHARNYLRS